MIALNAEFQFIVKLHYIVGIPGWSLKTSSIFKPDYFNMQTHVL